jgi:hypothetical protein
MLLAARTLLEVCATGAAPAGVADGGLLAVDDIAHTTQGRGFRLTFRTENGARIGPQVPDGTAGFNAPARLLAALCPPAGIPARGPGSYEVFLIWRSAQAGEPEGLPLRLEHDDDVTPKLLKFLVYSKRFLNVALRQGSFGDG